MDVSIANSQKLDRVLQLLEGTGPDAPGLLHQVKSHHSLLFGEGDKPGIIGKVTIMWRLHTWILCAASGLAGYLVKGMLHL